MKKKKNLIKIISIMALLAVVIGIGATLAYFTDYDFASNIIGTGHVDIILTEDMEDPENPEGPVIPYVDPVNLEPGAMISKMPKITVAEDSLDSYVRAVITVTNPEAAVPPVTIENIDIDENWVTVADQQESGKWYCYYIGGEDEGILKAGDSVYVFNQIELPGAWELEMNDQKILVDVVAQAVQAEGFTPTYQRDADGRITSCAWLDADGEEVEAEVYAGTNK